MMSTAVCAPVLLCLLALVSMGSCRSTTDIPSTTTEEPTDSNLSLRMVIDESVEKKDTGFYSCCKKNAIFQSEQKMKGVCNYSNPKGRRSLDALPKKKQSAWLKCLGDSKDYTSCCRDAGVSRPELFTCNFTAPFLDLSKWSDALEHIVQNVSIYDEMAQCVLNGVYSEE